MAWSPRPEWVGAGLNDPKGMGVARRLERRLGHDRPLQPVVRRLW